MIKKFFTLLIFSIAVVFTTGCDTPIGSLLADSSNGPTVDYIKAMPRDSYSYSFGKYDKFIPTMHVKVIGVFGGVESPIDINLVKVRIIQDRGYSDEQPLFEHHVTDLDGFFLKNDLGLSLDNTGVKTVVINYNNLEASYAIIVGEPGTGGGSWIDKSDGTGIIINWLD